MFSLDKRIWEGLAIKNSLVNLNFNHKENQALGREKTGEMEKELKRSALLNISPVVTQANRCNSVQRKSCPVARG